MSLPLSSRLGRFTPTMGTRLSSVLPRRMLGTVTSLRRRPKGSIHLSKDGMIQLVDDDDNIHRHLDGKV